MYNTRKQNPLRVKGDYIAFLIKSINIFVIYKVEETGCERLHGIKRHKKTNNIVSALHAVKNNYTGGQERKIVVKSNNMGRQERKRKIIINVNIALI